MRNWAWRLPFALMVTALVAFSFMRLAGGAAMFCIDPPAADAGWKWKVPLAWTVIYGLSTFLGVGIASFRPKRAMVPLVVAGITTGTFVLLRLRANSSGCSYFSQQEAVWGIPAMILGAVVACAIALRTKGPNQALHATSEPAPGAVSSSHEG
jgi:hypothetical protein